MLTRGNRLISSQLFSETVRRGRRAGSRTLVLHLHSPGPQDAGDQADDAAYAAPAPDAPARVGLVVSKAVGSAVTRNLVKRRLRHVARARLGRLPGSAVLVIRALPAAAVASYAALAADFDAALDRSLPRPAARSGGRMSR